MNVVVTGGGTIAPVDDVRLLTNVSSGRLAAAISEAFLDRGASVWHIHARSAQLPLRRRGPVRARCGRSLGRAGPADAPPPPMARPARSAAPGAAGNRARSPITRDARRPPSRPGRSTSPSWPWPSPTSSPSRTPGKLSSDVGIPGRALPAHSQGDPLGPRLGALGLPGRIQAALERAATTS